MSRRNAILWILLGALGSLGATSSQSCSSLPAVQLSNMINNNMTTRLSVNADPVYANERVLITATVTGDVTIDRYIWSSDGIEIAATTGNALKMTYLNAGRDYIEVEVQATELDGDPVSDFAGLYIDIVERPATTPSAGEDDSTPAATATVTISGPDELAFNATGTYSASASVSGAASGVTIAWDLLGSGATLGSTSGPQTTVTAVEAGFVSLVAEARDAATGRVLGSKTKSIGITAGYRAYITRQICTSGQLEIRREDEVAAGIPLCSLDGGGNDCSINTELTPVTDVYGTAEEAAKALCPSISSIYRHYWAGMIAVYNGTDTCLGVSAINSGVLECAQ